MPVRFLILVTVTLHLLPVFIKDRLIFRQNLCAELKRSGIPYATDVDEDLFDDEMMASLLNMLKVIRRQLMQVRVNI